MKENIKIFIVGHGTYYNEGIVPEAAFTTRSGMQEYIKKAREFDAGCCKEKLQTILNPDIDALYEKQDGIYWYEIVYALRPEHTLWGIAKHRPMPYRYEQSMEFTSIYTKAPNYKEAFILSQEYIKEDTENGTLPENLKGFVNKMLLVEYMESGKNNISHLLLENVGETE